MSIEEPSHKKTYDDISFEVYFPIIKKRKQLIHLID